MKNKIEFIPTRNCHIRKYKKDILNFDEKGALVASDMAISLGIRKQK